MASDKQISPGGVQIAPGDGQPAARGGQVARGEAMDLQRRDEKRRERQKLFLMLPHTLICQRRERNERQQNNGNVQQVSFRLTIHC